MLEQEYATNPYLKGLLVLGVLSVVLATYLAGYMTYTGDTGNELIVGALVLYVLGVTAICCFFALRSSDKTTWIWKERAHRERAKAQKLQSDVSRLELEVANLSKSTPPFGDHNLRRASAAYLGLLPFGLRSRLTH